MARLDRSIGIDGPWRLEPIPVPLSGTSPEPSEVEHHQQHEHKHEPEATFDLVVVANMHFDPEERSAFFGRAAAALVPGGHIFVIGHHLDSSDEPDHRLPSASTPKRCCPTSSRPTPLFGDPIRPEQGHSS